MSNFTVTAKPQMQLPSPERDRIIEDLAMMHFFDLEKLIAWADRLTSGTWWSTAPEAAELSYSPAMECYLRDCWGTADDPATFAEDMEAITEALYLARGWRNKDEFCFGHPMHPVHDGFLLLLDSHIDRLKTVFRLDQDSAKSFPADPAKLASLDADIQQLPSEIGFADWVLDTWLPAHILYYGRKAMERENEEKARALRERQGGGYRAHTAGGPGDLTP